MIGTRLLKRREEIRNAMRPYLCKHTRPKRQYDVKTVIASLEQSACLKSSDYDLKGIATGDGMLHFVAYGYWCCITLFID